MCWWVGVLESRALSQTTARFCTLERERNRQTPLLHIQHINMACEFILHKEDSGKAALNLIEKSLLMSQYDKLLVNLTDEAKDDTIDEVIFTKSKLENKLWGQHPSGVLKLANLLRNNQLCCVHTLVLASCDLETLPDMGTMRRSLRKLDVRGNRMTVLPDLRCVSGLEELHIQGNPVPMLPGEREAAGGIL